ncbi:unnamed protein product [Lathyrus sativus]|nr:unnamed protein product [Lathyrus sativus]
MEIQPIVSGFSPKSSHTPSIPNGNQLFSLKFHSILSSSCPSLHSQNSEVLSGAYFPINIAKKGRCYSSRRRVWCSSSRGIADPNKGHGVRAQVTERRKKLVVFVSGGGSNFKSIHEASKRGSLHGYVIVLVTNKSKCGGAEYARNNGIPVILFPKANDESDGLCPNDLLIH